MTVEDLITRRSFSGLLTAILVALGMPEIVQARDTPVANNVVLVHGLLLLQPDNPKVESSVTPLHCRR